MLIRTSRSRGQGGPQARRPFRSHRKIPLPKNGFVQSPLISSTAFANATGQAVHTHGTVLSVPNTRKAERVRQGRLSLALAAVSSWQRKISAPLCAPCIIKSTRFPKKICVGAQCCRLLRLIEAVIVQNRAREHSASDPLFSIGWSLTSFLVRV
jgi:hypothetical protein